MRARQAGGAGKGFAGPAAGGLLRGAGRWLMLAAAPRRPAPAEEDGTVGQPGGWVSVNGGGAHLHGKKFAVPVE